jgi:hypothetical protein
MQLWRLKKKTTKISTTLKTTTFIPVRSRDIVPLIINLGCREKCPVTITSPTLFPFQSTPVPIQHEYGWTPESGWILQRRK